MILIEFICKFAEWLWKYIVKPFIRFPYWLATARDCNHCKYYKQASLGNTCICVPCCFKNDQIKCDRTRCYHTIVRKDFERKKHKDV